MSALIGGQITVTPGVAGNFRLFASTTQNGHSSYDAGEELSILRLAIIRVTLDANNSTIESHGVTFTGTQNGVRPIGNDDDCVVCLKRGS